MSENNEKDQTNSGNNEGDSKRRINSSNRSPSPNPFLQYLSSSPSNISPRSEGSVSISPRSPRFQNNGMRMPGSPFNGSSISNDMLTAG
jgi:hypothetical protein